MLIRSGLILAVGVLLGRLLGFFRETLIASQFGVSGLADVAILTLTLPDLFMNVLLGGRPLSFLYLSLFACRVLDRLGYIIVLVLFLHSCVCY